MQEPSPLSSRAFTPTAHAAFDSEFDSVSQEWWSAFGPSLPFAWVRTCLRSARRGRRYPQRAHAGAVYASLRLRCGARLEVAPRTRCAHCVRYAQTGAASQTVEARCARRLQDCAPRRSRNRPLRVAPAAPPTLGVLRRKTPAIADAAAASPALTKRAIAQEPWTCIAMNQPVVARWAAPGGGDFWGDEQRRPGVGARQRASTSNSPRLFERSERSERSELCGATPGRAAQWSRSEAQTAPA